MLQYCFISHTTSDEFKRNSTTARSNGFIDLLVEASSGRHFVDSGVLRVVTLKRLLRRKSNQNAGTGVVRLYNTRQVRSTALRSGEWRA
jgi:hypothetical protein